MMTEVATIDKASLLEQVVVGGNLSVMSATDRLKYYNAVCQSVGLNPLTRPFDYITLNGKLTLYAKRDATDQLRKIHGVSITRLEREVVDGVYSVTAFASDKQGRTDSAIGAVAIDGQRGEAKANSMMKAETKAKRRVTLSICGLGMLDETEVDSVPGAVIGEPPATTVITTIAADAPMADDEQIERNSKLAELFRLTKALKLNAAERAAFKKEYCGDANADVMTAPLDSIIAMVDAMKAREPKA